MKNITGLKDCYGCGVCVKACPTGIIALRENPDGFYSPVIDEPDRCIDCGLCLKICAFNHKETASPAPDPDIRAYAAWSNDHDIRRWCSSGGIGFEIGRQLIGEGYEAVGVRYDPASQRAEHYIASSVREFMPSVGSKYIPSLTAGAFAAIDLRRKYLVTGTPCQIDSMRRLIRHFRREDNFILLDFFCHGVPSLLIWDKYMKAVAGKRAGEVSFASWRNKSAGWQDSWSVNIDYRASGHEDPDIYDLSAPEGCHDYTSRYSKGDVFYRFFLGNYCLNRCCYESCKYKMTRSAADIRIGDLWGKKYSNDPDGVSGVITFTACGRDLLGRLGEKVTLIAEPESTVTEGQMSRPPRMPAIYRRVIEELRSEKSLSDILCTTIRRYNLRFLHFRIANRILRMLHLPVINYH